MSVYSLSSLFACNRSGYEAAVKHFAPGDLDVNLSDRSFMITGANSGIGKATAQEIANRGEWLNVGRCFFYCLCLQVIVFCIYTNVVTCRRNCSSGMSKQGAS